MTKKKKFLKTFFELSVKRKKFSFHWWDNDNTENLQNIFLYFSSMTQKRQRTVRDYKASYGGNQLACSVS
jgi:hypothetical protein